MFNNLIGSAPGTLNSLKEFADALANDSNYATNIQTQLEDKIGNAVFFATMENYETKVRNDES